MKSWMISYLTTLAVTALAILLQLSPADAAEPAEMGTDIEEPRAVIDVHAAGPSVPYTRLLNSSKLTRGNESFPVLDAIATVDESRRTCALILVNRHP